MFRPGPVSDTPCRSTTSFDPDLCPERLQQVAEALMRGDGEQRRLAGELQRLAERLRGRPT